MNAPFQLFDALPAHIEDALRASIERFGVLVPVTVDQHGQVLDGHHRKRIAEELGVPYDRLVRPCDDDDERREIAHTLNADRRQLDTDELRQAAINMAKWRDDRGVGVSDAVIGKTLGVTRQAIREHLEDATSKGLLVERPDRVRGLDGKDRPLRRPQVIARDDREQQRAQAALEIVPDVPAARTLDVKRVERIAREVEREERQRAAAAVDTTAPPTDDPPAITVNAGEWWQLGRHLLYCGDSTDPAFIDRAGGAAFAFADPPYNAGKADWDHEFKWQHDYLTEVAKVAAVTPGISAVADFYAATAMPYRWSMSAWITNGMTRGALGFGNWIYVALFSTADSLHRNAQDHLRITVDSSTTGETIHESRKPAGLLVELLHLFTATGDTVVDPFLGSGTTLFAAEQTGRRCVGAELNPAYCRDIIARFGPEARPL